MNDHRSDLHNDDLTNTGGKLKPFNKDSLKFRVLKAPMSLGLEESDAVHPAYTIVGESEYVEVQFKGNRRHLFKNPNNLHVELYDDVIVTTDNGTEMGSVCCNGQVASNKLQNVYKEIAKDNYIVLRHATAEDYEIQQNVSLEEQLTLEKTKEMVVNYNLEMKITETEWQFDRQRLTIFFTAAQRIDFRELVKDLARTFRTRIELRQISSREETKRIGCGFGACGLELCCNSFLPQFNHVTLDHARKQQLSNNVAKLSGYCGRLKCCLLYEYETYEAAFEEYPELRSKIVLEDGSEAKLIKVDVFKDIAHLYNMTHKKYITLEKAEILTLIGKGKVFKNEEYDEDEIRALAEIQELEDAPEGGEQKRRPALQQQVERIMNRMQDSNHSQNNSELTDHLLSGDNPKNRGKKNFSGPRKNGNKRHNGNSNNNANSRNYRSNGKNQERTSEQRVAKDVNNDKVN